MSAQDTLDELAAEWLDADLRGRSKRAASSGVLSRVQLRALAVQLIHDGRKDDASDILLGIQDAMDEAEQTHHQGDPS